jgi:hypothetical protein
MVLPEKWKARTESNNSQGLEEIDVSTKVHHRA